MSSVNSTLTEHPDEDHVVRCTRSWVREVVIGLGLCPFAGRVYERGEIAYMTLPAQDTSHHLEHLADTVLRMDEEPAIRTSLLIYPDSYRGFDSYLDYLALSEALLRDMGCEGSYQLASFHPDYCFEGCAEDDAANYSNRSPWPMLHLLREEDISQAVASYPDIDSVPGRNIERLRSIGNDRIRDTLDLLKKV